MQKQYIQPSLIILVAICLMAFAAAQVKQIAQRCETQVIALLQEKDLFVARIDAAKSRHRQLQPQESDVVTFLKRWNPEFERNDTNEIISAIESLAIQARVVSLSPKVGQAEDVYIAGEAVTATPFSFTFIAESVTPLHKLIYDVQQEFKGMRVTSISITSESEKLHMKMELIIPTKGVLQK